MSVGRLGRFSTPNTTHNQSTTPSSTEELIDAAEQLKASLRDTLGKTNDLIVGLKRHRKEAKIVRTTLDSLRQLQTVGSVESPRNTKTNIAVANNGTPVVAIGGPTAGGNIAERAATRNTAFAGYWSARVIDSYSAVLVVPILAPFKNIAVHVVHSPRVGQFATNTVSVLLANVMSILVVPSVLPQLNHIIAKAA